MAKKFKHKGCKIMKAHIYPSEYRIETKPYFEEEHEHEC